MTHSPGHQKWPEHKVLEKPIQERIQVTVRGELVADSRNAIEVDEDDHPARLYVPRPDVDMDKLSGSNTRTTCPFKGQAHYFDLNFGVKQVKDAAWSYQDPYEEHMALKDRIAFHDELPEVEIKRIH